MPSSGLDATVRGKPGIMVVEPGIVGQALAGVGPRKGFLLDLAGIEQLLDHVPEVAFFIKDQHGRYLVVNQSLVERCGYQDRHELLGRLVSQVFPRELAEAYAQQDLQVLRRRQPIIDHLELHWYPRRKPGWCLTTKLPLLDSEGNVRGLMGISRDLRAPGDRNAIPASLVNALEYLEKNYGDPISPRALALRASLPPVRFARLVKRIYGVTPNQLILQTRLHAATQLLIETEQPVSEIALACGFYDHSAFARAFRAVTDLTPTRFRGLRRAEAGELGRTRQGSRRPPKLGVD